MIVDYHTQAECLSRELRYREAQLARHIRQPRLHGWRIQASTLARDTEELRAALGTVQVAERMETILRQLRVTVTANRKKCDICDAVAKVLEEIT